MPNRDDPLQVSARNERLITSGRPAASQKDILDKNIGKAKYKNNIVEKEYTKTLLQVNRFKFEIKVEKRIYTDKNAAKHTIEIY